MNKKWWSEQLERGLSLIIDMLEAIFKPFM